MALTMSIDFAANIARLEENTKKAATAVERMAGRMDSAASFASTAVMRLLPIVSVAAFGSAIRGAIDLADSLNDLSKRTGASVEMLGGLRLAAMQSGTSLDAIANGTKKLATSMVEHRSAFERLGINTKDQTQALIQLGDVFAGMEDPVQRSALAVKVFGKSGDEMLPLLMEGSEGIRRMIERGQELGGVTTDMARQADLFNDSLAELKLRSGGAAISIANELLPALNSLAAELAAGQRHASGFFDAIATFGTINPFRTQAENITAYRTELEELTQARAQYLERGFSTAAFDRDIEDVQKKLRYLKELQAGQALEGGAANQSAAESKRLGLGGGRASGAGASLLGDLSGASVALEKMRQKDIDGWVKYADTVLAEGETIEAAERARLIRENETSAARELAWQQGVAQRLAARQMAGMSEAEIERGKLTAIQNDLQSARDMGWLTEVEHHRAVEQAQLEHEAMMGNIMAQGALTRQKVSQQSWMNQAGMAASWLKNMTSTAATSNRTMFNLNKIAGISEAVINTYRAATGAYAAMAPIPIIGPALGAAAAGIAIAAGMANVNAIKSAQFGSATSAPSIGGGGAVPVMDVGATAIASPSVPEVAQPRQQINFHFTGSQISMDQMVNEFIPRLEEAYGNGAGGGAVFTVTRN